MSCSAPPCLADTVVLSAGSDGRGTMEVTGEIVDYTGREIIIRRDGGTERSYPAGRVMDLEADLPEALQDGLLALKEGHYARAGQLLTAAVRADPRPWVRRLAIEGLIEFYTASGDWATAGRLLVELARSDPATPAVERAPLAWFVVEGVPPASVDQWLTDQESPIAQLLGASHALAGSRRDQALQQLRRLAGSTDSRIAFLARAQSWRAEVVTASAADVDRWEQFTRQAPEELQSGAWVVLGDARRQLRGHDRAALAYLRAATLAGRQPQLAAHALWQASQAVASGGHQQEAVRIAGQLVAEHPHMPPAREARAMLQSKGNR